jgi:hypothetical protein
MDTKFKLNAKSCTLINQESEKSLIGYKNYIIPIYQRPYSWNEEQIRRLFIGIILAYKRDEPYFLGTMQVIPQNGSFEVVDGQQRLTTLLLLFKVLDLKYSNTIRIHHELTKFKWLTTKVNKEEQQSNLNKVISISTYNELLNKKLTDELNTNLYLNNALLIDDLIIEIENEDSEENKHIEFNQSFFEYITSQLYFVIIETTAGLTKTLEIFNTINTAGMDLNGGDVFKIRMFEYLTRVKQNSDSVFDEIDEIYAKIDHKNKEYGWIVTDIHQILETYKYILIEKTKSSRALHFNGSDTFFDKLFSVLLLNENQQSFDREKFLLSLDLETINRLVDIRYKWEELVDESYSHYRWSKFIEWSRYGRYNVLDYIYLFKFYNSEFELQTFRKFNEKIAKLFIINSILFAKSTNYYHTFVHDLISSILEDNSTQQNTLEFIQEYLDEIDKEWLKDVLSGYILEPRKKKDLICYLSAILEEDKDFQNNEDYTWDKFFNNEIDIEHIQPCNPDEENSEEWNDELHTIGNLVLLERGLNRSSEKIGNRPFEEKMIGYKESEFKIINDLISENTDNVWTVEKCKLRKEKEVNKIMNFLFETN